MTIKIFFLCVLFLAGMTRSDLSEKCIFPGYTVLLNIVQVDDEFEGKSVFAAMEGCEVFWAFRAAELFMIHLNQVLSSCKKSRIGYNKELNVEATIIFCHHHHHHHHHHHKHLRSNPLIRSASRITALENVS